MKEKDKIPYTNFEIDESNMKPKLSDQQLYEIKQKHDNQDEELLNQLNNQTKQIKVGQNLMKNILKKEQPLLDNVNDDMDRVENKMKMEIIGIELFILFLLFLM